MGLNSRIKQWLSDAEGAGLTGANGAPDVGLVGVTDGSGNILKVTDNGDGTFTPQVQSVAAGSETANQGTPNAGGAANAWPVAGAGTAGTPAGGVVSVQGVVGGTSVPTSAPTPATILNQASAAKTASGQSTALTTSGVATLEVDINITAVSGTVPSCTFSYQQTGADGVAYTVWTSSAQTATGQVRTSIGPGLANTAVLLSSGLLVWTITGTTPSFTFSASVVGR